MKKEELQTPVLECPKCRAYGKYGSGGKIEIATGNMTDYEFRCRECGHTWGANAYFGNRQNLSNKGDGGKV